MTTLYFQRFDRRVASVVEAHARTTEYARLSVFPGRP
jgi:hypothetical protein